jgi:hypothetical protein
VAELGVAYFSGGALATTVGVDGVFRIAANLAKTYAYATAGKSAGNETPTNLGGMVGSVFDGKMGGPTQHALESVDNATMLVISGGPLTELSEIGQTMSTAQKANNIISSVLETRDIHEELRKYGK